MKLLFIGGTGNISLSVSKLALAAGHSLTLLNRGGSSELPDAEHLACDISDESAARAALANREFDAVVNWIAFNAADVARDVRLFNGLTSHYVLISSASCYQNPGPTPYITERTPLANPYWDYSREKIAAEQQLLSAFHQQRFPGTIVRPSFTYDRVIPLSIGGWQEYTACARMKRGLPTVVQGDGTALWTITHAEDFARGFLGLLGQQDALGEDFHITSDEFLSWNEIYQLTAAALGVTAQLVPVTSAQIVAEAPAYAGTLLGDKSASALFDNSKIKQLVPDFKTQIPFARGIERTIAWFEADPSRQRINPATDQLIDRLIERYGAGI